MYSALTFENAEDIDGAWMRFITVNWRHLTNCINIKRILLHEEYVSYSSNRSDSAQLWTTPAYSTTMLGDITFLTVTYRTLNTAMFSADYYKMTSILVY